MTSPERGSGSVASIGIICVVVILGVSVLLVLSVLATKVKVQNVADGAALAAGREAALSRWVGDGSQACSLAREYVEEAAMRVRSCQVKDGDIWLEVGQEARVLGDVVEVCARARAGPQE